LPVDYEPFTGPWGRPQPDGPGSRIITLATLAIYLLTTGDEQKIAYVKRALYPGTPSEGIEYAGVIKGDLEYVATSWRKYGFDLWEEVSGRHFYTLLTLRTALFLGARLATQLGDVSASTRYMAAADEIDPYLRRFWDDERGIMKVTIDFGKEPEAGAHSGTSDGHDSVVAQQQQQEQQAQTQQATKAEKEEETGVDAEWHKLEKVVKADETHGKTSGLDTAVILAVLHAGRGTPWARITTGIDAVADPPFENASKVLSTLVELMDQFSVRYPLNAGRRANGQAVALGRYDEDVYDGVHMSVAHPWYLCTLGAAEFLFLLVSDLTAMTRSPTPPTMLPLTPLLHSTLTRLLPTLSPPLPAVNSALSPSDPAFKALVCALLTLGDSFISIVQEFVGQGGHLSEQFERDGVPRGSEPHEGGLIEDSKRDYSDGKNGEGEVEAIGRGARDLSWSYAAWITCLDERQRAVIGAERAGLTTAAGKGKAVAAL
jgi:glucoamylase